MPATTTANEHNSSTPTSPAPSYQALSTTSQRQIDAPSASGSISSPRSVIVQSKRATHSGSSPKLEPTPISPGAADPVDEHPSLASPAAHSRVRSSSCFSCNASDFSEIPGDSNTQRSHSINSRPKGPPASRSSRGIINITGPPPAWSTRRASSLIATTEDSRRALLAYDQRGTPPRLTPQNLASLDAITSQAAASQNTGVEGSLVSGIESSYHEAANREIGGAQESALRSTLNPFDAAMVATVLRESRQSRGEYYAGDDEDPLRGIVTRTSNGMDSLERPRLGGRSDSVGQSQEDLFLALANADNDQASMTNGSGTRERNERSSRVNGYKRRSIIYDNHSSFDPRPNDYDVNEPYQFGSSGASLQPVRNERRYASSAHPFDQRKKARLSSGPPRSNLYAPRESTHRLSSPELPQIYDRRRSAQGVASELPNRRYRHLVPQYFSSPLTGRPSTRDDYERGSLVGSRTGATESTVSTNASSTVWDELEDIKTRIQQLELSKALPSSGRASISGALSDRPLTANTTLTNTSSSPKRAAARKPSTSSQTLGEPLRDSAAAAALVTALEQVKPDITTAMYQSMEVAANNAVAITNMCTTAGRQQPLSNVTDRQLRRKADELCRSLTDVCIALSKERLEWNDKNSRPESVCHDGPNSRRSSAYHDAIEVHASDAADAASPTFQRGRSPERRVSVGEGSNAMKLSEAEFLNRMDPKQYPLSNESTANHAIARFNSQSQHHASSLPPNPDIQISRSSSLLQRTRPHTSEIPTDQPRPPPLRPLSRAVTDYNFSRAQPSRESSVPPKPPPPAQISPLHRPPSSVLAFPDYNEQYTPSVKSTGIPFRSASVVGSSPVAFTPALRLQEKPMAPSVMESKKSRLEELKAKIARHG